MSLDLKKIFEVIRGNFDDVPSLRKKIVRIFISSTFTGTLNLRAKCHSNKKIILISFSNKRHNRWKRLSYWEYLSTFKELLQKCPWFRFPSKYAFRIGYLNKDVLVLHLQKKRRWTCDGEYLILHTNIMGHMICARKKYSIVKIFQ